ncbi:MAG: hypothetical protein H7Y38_18880 [Armatimonadetes bacterium]|nr:hypothetical protein [Armatimonadota bacterium]
MDELLTRFDTDDREAVRSFLLTEPVLIFPLQASVPEIEKVFGAGVRIVLEPVVNPETDDLPVLCALIQITDGDIEGAIERMDSFSRDWWYTSRPRVDEKLLFNVEMSV